MTDARSETLAFAESPVQLLNTLEWAHTSGPGAFTVIILPPHDPTSRGQLRRMAQLARDSGCRVLWREARGGAVTPSRALAALAGPLRRARRLVIGDPFSHYLQLLLSMAGRCDIVVVDDGTATMEFTAQLSRGERLVRWHRPRSRGPRSVLFAPVARRAVRRLSPAAGRTVEVFTVMPVKPVPGITVTANTFAWSRSHFPPPRLTGRSDLVGTSLVETGVLHEERYITEVAALAREHHITRYFAHRKEGGDKLRRLATAAGLEIVRPDLPLELVARRGPIGSKIISFPSTVVHTLPHVLADTEVEVVVRDVAKTWFTDRVTDRASGFLAEVTNTARGARGLQTGSQ
ncbi:hypothetical protein [Streptomyces radicis]|uniref:Uncharacterized protein n=1 Tax=Streptomyces radicis TaxID=1750517 RepID=A0A3A9VXJ7_9ACTN|nr:hypothetical protein [Streptomyces radicis]RKN05232.1 hypothetical protein D7319_26040 [Streptomyces radicis]RKN16765.1 hypothetical protein D7318_25405 [Streptomyces radicis]